MIAAILGNALWFILGAVAMIAVAVALDYDDDADDSDDV